MLDQHQLEQHDRIAAWPAVVLAVQILDQLIYVRKIHRRVDFPQQMLLRHQHVHSISIACRCSVSFFSIFITASIYKNEEPTPRSGFRLLLNSLPTGSQML